MRLTSELQQIMDENGYILAREIVFPDGSIEVCAVLRFMFTVGMVYGIDESGYKGRFCFHDLGDAIECLVLYKGEAFPPGPWIKHKGHGVDIVNPNKEYENER